MSWPVIVGTSRVRRERFEWVYWWRWADFGQGVISCLARHNLSPVILKKHIIEVLLCINLDNSDFKQASGPQCSRLRHRNILPNMEQVSPSLSIFFCVLSKLFHIYFGPNLILRTLTSPLLLFSKPCSASTSLEIGNEVLHVFGDMWSTESVFQETIFSGIGAAI